MITFEENGASGAMMLDYPAARIDDTTDTLAGITFQDPYRWLEANDEAVRRWQVAQARLASNHVRQWPRFDELHQLVARFSTERYVTLPRYAAGRWFRTSVAAGASQARAVVADEPMGEGRVLFDPVSEDRERPPFLSWISPSPDGRILAVGVCPDGSENNTIRLIDVESGHQLDDCPAHVLMDNWTGGVSWLPDSSGFFFTAISGAAIELAQHVYLYRRAPQPGAVLVDVPWSAEIGWSKPRDYRMVTVSRDGRYAIAVERRRNPVPVAVAKLGEGPIRWKPFITAFPDHAVAGHAVGDHYIAVTDVGAPRGRLVAIPLDCADPNNPDKWQQLVGESPAVLRTVTPIGNVLYLTEFIDTYARVSMVDLHGDRIGELPLPGRGAISEHGFAIVNLLPKGHPEKFLFAFSSLTSSWGIYCHTPGREQIDTLMPPRVQLDGAIVEDRSAVSADGTRIPYHVVRCADVDAAKPHPTLIWAYGGFNLPLAPQFPGAMAAFVAAGGVFVHAHLRGGSELGLEWWRSGRQRNKQNCYDDLYAIAEDLIVSNRTTPQLLAVTGGSNGGLLAAVAATQRPELWKAVVPRVPAIDLIGSCREPYTRQAAMTEYCADIEDPAEVYRLAAISPYHLVRKGVSYPAVFLDAGDTDCRCPPWHARKLAASLQAAAAGPAPILLHVWDNVGHGFATDKLTAVAQNTEWLAFTMRHLGLDNWRRGAR